MYPPIFAALSASIAVKALIGSNPVRGYPFGGAPQGVAMPYVVWQTVGGLPENYLGQRPDIDSFTLQIDCYAATASAARAVAAAVRDAVEAHAHIVAWRGEERDPETMHYRYSFDVDWFVHR